MATMRCRVVCVLLALALCCVHVLLSEAAAPSSARPRASVVGGAPAANVTAAVLPDNINDVLEIALKAKLKAQAELTEARGYCLEAKQSAEMALEDEKKAEEILKKLDAGAIVLSRSLLYAKEATKEAEDALRECLAAERAAEAAEGETHKVVYGLLNLTMDRWKEPKDGNMLKQAADQTALAVQKADEAERYSDEAAAAAEKTHAAAGRAATAQSLAHDVVVTATALLRKREDEEKRRQAKERADAEAAKQAAVAEVMEKFSVKQADQNASSDSKAAGASAPGKGAGNSNTKQGRNAADGSGISLSSRASLLLTAAVAFIGCFCLC
uniref:Surface protein TolT n=2 Tax=Trypanosoma rangeli TaxID=5698 RepID=R9TL85_TRYRA|nr:surface protein TolT [Trypanosoma rangeli]